MADAENAVSASKKRVAGRQISKDNPELEDDTSEPEMGTFQRASEEVLASRKIVKVRRQQPASNPSSNPFAAIRLVSSTESSAQVEPQNPADKADLGESNGDDKHGENSEIKSGVLFDEPNGTGESSTAVEEVLSRPSEIAAEVAAEENNPKEVVESARPFSSFGQLSSSQNAFTGLSGTGFGTSSFSFGSLKEENSTFGSFTFASSNNGASSLRLFGSSGTDAAKNGADGGGPSLQGVPVVTGEENEKAVFTADATLYEYLDGSWKERGKGEVKVNTSTSISGERAARFVMRARGNYRLILNASLYPDMTLANMDKKGITFSCINSAGEGRTAALTTCALKFKDISFVEEFRGVVAEYTEKKAIPLLKTPENSPRTSDE